LCTRPAAGQETPQPQRVSARYADEGAVSRDNRRQSHGCVRVQNPRELAALLLQEPVDWVNQAIAVGYTHRQPLPALLPVFFVYQTVVAEPGASIHFYSDVYRRDAEIWNGLHESAVMISLSNGPKSETVVTRR
jgi:murein L,D-transpeptidase YcbB/YkuD